jgi:hypothetical protein
MQPAQANQQPLQELRKDALDGTTFGGKTSGSGDTLTLQIQLAQLEEDFRHLSASSNVFDSLRAFVHSHPAELGAQQEDLARQQPEIRARTSEVPGSGTLPSVQTLIFEINFANFERDRAEAGEGGEVSFAA